jgi:hypothetical protein
VPEDGDEPASVLGCNVALNWAELSFVGLDFGCKLLIYWFENSFGGFVIELQSRWTSFVATPGRNAIVFF